MPGRYWLVCDNFAHRDQTPCVFDEHTALQRGDPPRCIRHGAILFTDTTLNGCSREEAKRIIKQRCAD